MSKKAIAFAGVAAVLLSAWGMNPRVESLQPNANIGWSVYQLTQDEVSSIIIGGAAGGAAAYAGGEAGAKVGGFFGGIAGAAIGGVLGAL
jgi:hypothetical protein